MRPSAKNRQPWRFVVVRGAKEKQRMLQVFRSGIEREQTDPLLPGSSQHLADALYTIGCMEQAPVSIFVLNTLGLGLATPLSLEERAYESANLQSVSAAVQNMLLTAQAHGLGSLWICNVFFAYPELTDWLQESGDLVAAVSLGYPMEHPSPRPRKPFAEVVRWKE